MKIVSPQPRLVLCAHTWSMVGHPAPRREWTLDRKLAAIKAAGFDGVAAFINPEIADGARRHGLKLLSGFDCGDLPTVTRRLSEQRDCGVHFINIQLLNHDTPPARAAAMAVKLIKLSRRLGLGVHIETHRDTATETPEKFTEIARRYRRVTGETMPVTWDHSHFAVSKHVLPKDYAARLLAWPREIQHSQLFHLRPFNSQHCQVPVTDGRGRLTPEFLDYRAFVEELFVLWLRGPRPGGELWVCPEMGMTHGYNVSTNPPVWPDVIRCRRELLGCWRRALRRVA
ncbi:sugar phosphate isomerase/epimerase [Oleiharenicola lentus]|uniref:Sugar phosphate isomerase/epimerase n=1 Tax=Oleiharenicola lentus TaxID=2508720 RepID=A0A4Q1CAW0_9BACT|nr:sugar phosphate isomerase/epimerase [Oleiharenicola lentus]RXK56233.1 sugar phosphate isomerase/epimerase [Oleiharenicola lentus]